MLLTVQKGPDTSPLIIAIIIILVLIGIFFISYIFNERTPIPKGCEDVLREVEKCHGCNNKSCRFYEEVTEEK